MKSYIQQIDITSDGKVVILGQLSRTNLEVKLNEHLYIEEPEDGIWNYTLEVIPTSAFGVDMIVPFTVEAPWTGNKKANGVRIIQPSMSPNQPDYETVQMKVKKVESFTKTQDNFITINGANFDKVTKQLIIDVTYSGGCSAHLFSLEWDGISLESYPPQYNFILVDLSKYDSCKAILKTQLRFDIETPSIRLEKPSVIILGTVGGNRKIQLELD